MLKTGPALDIFGANPIYRKPDKTNSGYNVSHLCSPFDFFRHCATFSENNLFKVWIWGFQSSDITFSWHFEVVLLFMSLRYGADLGRSWHVWSITITFQIQIKEYRLITPFEMSNKISSYHGSQNYGVFQSALFAENADYRTGFFKTNEVRDFISFISCCF